MGGDQGSGGVQQKDADSHDQVAEDHERPELTKTAVGAVHQSADNGVGNGVEQTHAGDHDRGKQQTQRQHVAAKGSNVGEYQHIVYVGSAVIQREQHQLVGFGAIDPRRFCGLFAHLDELLSEKKKRGCPFHKAGPLFDC